MFSVYRKELKLFFSVKSTYLILSLLLLVIGIFAAVLGAAGSLHHVPVYMTVPTLIAFPLIQIFAAIRARRSGATQLYHSLPLSPAGILIEKYLATLTLALIPTASLVLLTLCYSALTSLSSATVYTSVLGYFLFCALILALEQLLHTILRGGVIAVVLSYLVPIVAFLYHTLLAYLPLGETALRILTALDPIGTFYAFTYGVFPLADLFTLLMGIAACLLLSILAAKRAIGAYARKPLKGICFGALSVAVALCLSVAGALIPDRLMNPDVSGSTTFLISASTKDFLKTVDRDVTVYLLSKGGSKNVDKSIQGFLYRYEESNPHVTVKVIDTDKDSAFLKQYGAEELNDQSFVVVSEQRHMLLDSNELYHYYNADLGISLSPTQYAYYLSAYLEYMQTQQLGNYSEQAVQYGAQLYSSTTTVAYFDGDLCLTNAIRYATQEHLPVAYVYSGTRTIDTALRSYLINNGYFFHTLTSLQSIPADCDVLMIHAPQVDLTPAEQSTLESYLAGGGDMLLVTDYQYPQLPNLFALTAQYGMSTFNDKHLVCEQEEGYLFVKDEGYYFAARVASVPFTKSFDGYVAILPAHSITVSDTPIDGVTVTPLLYTGDTGYLMYEGGDEDRDNAARYVCGAYAQKGESTLLWISSPDTLSNMGNSMSGGGNFTLLESALDYATANEYALLPVAPTVIQSAAVLTDSTMQILINLFFILLLPLAMLATGAVRIYLRRKR